MICKSCGGLLPELALACATCVQRKADAEMTATLVARLRAGEMDTLPIAKGHVLLRRGKALCGKNMHPRTGKQYIPVDAVNNWVHCVQCRQVVRLNPKAVAEPEFEFA